MNSMPGLGGSAFSQDGRRMNTCLISPVMAQQILLSVEEEFGEETYSNQSVEFGGMLNGERSRERLRKVARPANTLPTMSDSIWIQQFCFWVHVCCQGLRMRSRSQGGEQRQ